MLNKIPTNRTLAFFIYLNPKKMLMFPSASSVFTLI